jgi:hypothetical protein
MSLLNNLIKTREGNVRYLAKVKQSLDRPGQVCGIPGGWDSKISRYLVHEDGKVVSPAPLRPRKYSWYAFLLEAIVRPEGLCLWKIPLAPSEIEPSIFRLEKQFLNQLRHSVPYIVLGCLNKSLSICCVILTFYTSLLSCTAIVRVSRQ